MKTEATATAIPVPSPTTAAPVVAMKPKLAPRAEKYIKMARETAVRPFFRAKGEIEIHPDMIKDLASENLETAKGVWQFEYWLPSTEKQAAEYEGQMSAKDPGGWTTHRGRAKRQMGEAPE